MDFLPFLSLAVARGGRHVPAVATSSWALTGLSVVPTSAWRPQTQSLIHHSSPTREPFHRECFYVTGTRFMGPVGEEKHEAWDGEKMRMRVYWAYSDIALRR